MSQLLQVSENQIIPSTRPEEFFRLLYGANMNAYPKRKLSRRQAYKGKRDENRQWVYVGTKQRMKSMTTQATLYAVLGDPNFETPFYTPNGYYRRDLRWTESLRWLNAFAFDFDNYGESVADVLERIAKAGLPRPTLIVKTPSGGYHVIFVFTEPVRATKRAITLYSAIMWHMVEDLGSDMAALGANRIFRTPTEQNMVLFESENCYSFDMFKEWREINHPYAETSRFINIHTDDLMDQPALQYLLAAPCNYGTRDEVAFTLALAMKASGWSQRQAEVALGEWHSSCCVKGAGVGKKPFSRRDAIYKASYVFRSSRYHAPKAEIVRRLTGMPFYYRTRNHWENAKPRKDRDRSHLYEWEADLIELLQTEMQLSGSQQELATRLGCPLTSFKVIIGQLKQAGKITVETRRGRGGLTVISLPEAPDSVVKEEQVIVLPVDHNKPATAVKAGLIAYVDFKNRKVERIEPYMKTLITGYPVDPEPPD